MFTDLMIAQPIRFLIQSDFIFEHGLGCNINPSYMHAAIKSVLVQTGRLQYVLLALETKITVNRDQINVLFFCLIQFGHRFFKASEINDSN